ncbi:hypothetical protein INT46_009244 [Mucor plumbeus]|uniref:Uncharacterized protein n=1 Tax=Mucor plumbeus TaxID=97098 RepID=A0A8H7QW26_9FUNG|nr:hypothetical protein INT46_009244 [Mucor plumbeus]
MAQIQHIQENVPSKTAFPGFVHHSLKEINHACSLSSRAFRILKDSVLNAIDSKEPLKIPNKIRKLDIEALNLMNNFY